MVVVLVLLQTKRHVSTVFGPTNGNSLLIVTRLSSNARPEKPCIPTTIVSGLLNSKYYPCTIHQTRSPTWGFPKTWGNYHIGGSILQGIPNSGKLPQTLISPLQIQARLLRKAWLIMNLVIRFFPGLGGLGGQTKALGGLSTHDRESPRFWSLLRRSRMSGLLVYAVSN